MGRIQEEAANEAERIRRLTGADLPVDPVRVASLLGIEVFDAHLDAGVSGALVKQLGRDATILLNRNDSSNRRRFTAGHEIGHFVRNGSDQDVYEYIDFRDFLSSMGANEDEIFANEFAAALLMPAAEVRRLTRDRLSTIEMASRFGVSTDAMTYRLKNLGLAHAVPG